MKSRHSICKCNETRDKIILGVSIYRSVYFLNVFLLTVPREKFMFWLISWSYLTLTSQNIRSFRIRLVEFFVIIYNLLRIIDDYKATSQTKTLRTCVYAINERQRLLTVDIKLLANIHLRKHFPLTDRNCLRHIHSAVTVRKTTRIHFAVCNYYHRWLPRETDCKCCCNQQPIRPAGSDYEYFIVNSTIKVY